MSYEDFNLQQAKATESLDRALKKVKAAGLALRVYDGSIILCRVEDLKDPRYGSGGRAGAAWIEECTIPVGIGVNADGGAGI
ncbi:hypothetical protein K5D33_07590 [Pseudomonas cichorii]|nr:hypothetical protein [Pseudomonas cichorii]MBX8534585.1 hypothetical protein [Pseudomonas cichorii]